MQTNTLTQSKFSTYALLSLRILLVLIFLYHGVPKAIFWQKAMEKFVSFGLPGFLGPITGIAEVVAAVPLLFGRFWKISNLVLIFIIAGALVTVQIPNYISDPSKVAGLERDLLILVGHILLLAFDPNGKLASNKNSDY